MASARDDVFAAVSSWFDHEDACPVELEKELTSIGRILRGSNYSNLRGDPGLRDRIKGLYRRFQRLSATLNDITTALKRDIDIIESFSRMCGIGLLPDEVLAAVFEMVVNLARPAVGCYISRKWKAAVRLSHVDHRFRSIMLASPQLWTNMNLSRKMAAACLPRTNGLPLKIKLIIHDHDDRNERSFEPILAELLPAMGRWGRLQLTIYSVPSDHRRCDFDSLIEQLLLRLDAPSLEKLSIDYEDFDNERSPHWDWSQWNTPNLRRLKTNSYFPFALPGLSSVTTLDLTMSVDDDQMSRTLKEISRMHSLQNLTVKLLNTEDADPFVVHELLEFPQIRRLRIGTTLNFLIEDESMGFKRSIFSSTFFPYLAHLRLDIEGRDYTNVDEIDWSEDHSCDFYFNKEMNRIFRHINQFPKVESLYLNIVSPFGNHHNSEVHTEVAIPLNMLPSLKDFTLQSNTRFDIVDSDDSGEIVSDEELAVASRVVGNAFPILNTITLDMFDASVVAKWLGDYLGELKDRGKWEKFRELTIKEHDGKDLQKNLYPGEETLRWCEDKMTRYIQND